MQNLATRGGCRFIAGDPHAIHEKGEAIFCGKPVGESGGAWCAEHEVMVYVTLDQIRAMRKAA
jgi:hypothetical protein